MGLVGVKARMTNYDKALGAIALFSDMYKTYTIADTAATVRAMESEERKKTRKLSLLESKLIRLENRKNLYENEVIKAQTSKGQLLEEEYKLSDVYKTTPLTEITADIYDEPVKHSMQLIKRTEEQLKALDPYHRKIVSDIGTINRATNFLEKGIGVKAISGIEGDVSFGPEDMTYEQYIGDRYTKEQISGGEVPGYLEKLFGMHPPSESVWGGLEADRLKRLRAGEELRTAQDLRMRAPITADQIIRRDMSLKLLDEYEPDIDASQYGFISVNEQNRNYNEAVIKDDMRAAEDFEAKRDTELFRVGLEFLPHLQPQLGVNAAMTDEKLIEAMEQIKKDPSKSDMYNDVINTAQRLWQETVPRYNRSEVKNRFQLVHPFMKRDKLLARSYRIYRSMLKKNPTVAEKYNQVVQKYLGVDMALTGTVRNRLERFFNIDSMNARLGGLPLDSDWMSKIPAQHRLLITDWLKEVREDYQYDIINEKWIDSIDDSTGEIKYE